MRELQVNIQVRKRGGIKLNKTQLAEAYDFFNVIQSDKVVELGVFIEPTGGNTTRPGDSGTEIVEGDSPSKNENFRQFSLEFKDNFVNLFICSTAEIFYRSLRFF